MRVRVPGRRSASNWNWETSAGGRRLWTLDSDTSCVLSSRDRSWPGTEGQANVVLITFGLLAPLSSVCFISTETPIQWDSPGPWRVSHRLLPMVSPGVSSASPSLVPVAVWGRGLGCGGVLSSWLRTEDKGTSSAHLVLSGSAYLHFPLHEPHMPPLPPLLPPAPPLGAPPQSAFLPLPTPFPGGSSCRI